MRQLNELVQRIVNEFAQSSTLKHMILTRVFSIDSVSYCISLYNNTPTTSYWPIFPYLRAAVTDGTLRGMKRHIYVVPSTGYWRAIRCFNVLQIICIYVAWLYIESV